MWKRLLERRWRHWDLVENDPRFVTILSCHISRLTIKYFPFDDLIHQMERRQVPVLPLGRGDEAQQAEQLQAAGAEPGPRPRLHPAAVRCVDIEFRSSPHPALSAATRASPPATPSCSGRRRAARAWPRAGRARCPASGPRPPTPQVGHSLCTHLHI